MVLSFFCRTNLANEFSFSCRMPPELGAPRSTLAGHFFFYTFFRVANVEVGLRVRCLFAMRILVDEINFYLFFFRAQRKWAWARSERVLCGRLRMQVYCGHQAKVTKFRCVALVGSMRNAPIFACERAWFGAHARERLMRPCGESCVPTRNTNGDTQSTRKWCLWFGEVGCRSMTRPGTIEAGAESNLQNNNEFVHTSLSMSLPTNGGFVIINQSETW